MFECFHDFYSIKKPGCAQRSRPTRRTVLAVGPVSAAPPGDKHLITYQADSARAISSRVSMRSLP
ncbi:hypothetical protein E4005_02795 [Enterobacter roggenkampii]|nr:hypothetical protein E4005_02795 [Enterobacter roggenkampii]